MEKRFPKDETIKRWVLKKGKKNFEKEMLKRLIIVEQDYKQKKAKVQYILKRLRSFKN